MASPDHSSRLKSSSGVFIKPIEQRVITDQVGSRNENFYRYLYADNLIVYQYLIDSTSALG